MPCHDFCACSIREHYIMSLPPNRFATCFRIVLWVFRKSNKIKSANTGPALVDFALHHKVLAVLEQGVRHYWTHSVQSESLTLAMVEEIKVCFLVFYSTILSCKVVFDGFFIL